MDVIGTISRSLASKTLRVPLPSRRIATDSVYPRRRFVDPADGRKSLFGSRVKNRCPYLPNGRGPRHITPRSHKEPSMDVVWQSLGGYLLQFAESGGMSEKSSDEL